MTEASVSSTFMSALRKRLPYATVFKLRDASFIGLPDCVVTSEGRATWLEFKLWIPPKKWVQEDGCDVRNIAEKSPTQFEMMKKLQGAAPGQVFYIVWAKKSGMCYTWSPSWPLPDGCPVEQIDLIDWFLNWGIVKRGPQPL